MSEPVTEDPALPAVALELEDLPGRPLTVEDVPALLPKIIG